MAGAVPSTQLALFGSKPGPKVVLDAAPKSSSHPRTAAPPALTFAPSVERDVHVVP